jgi:hypothetical protein
MRANRRQATGDRRQKSWHRHATVSEQHAQAIGDKR